ncbi:hypothetical protein [Thermogemmatispora tikiterensis]|uniref:Uncharacterized protein n=1 Tax=Thermogemmatispora tikiterensis TaxID=1825093 RepID=A0A328V8K8_9CHLR|nr:hypothetical protein [Thermogemmatispora tikiterensis]RAQ93946.1 hypothetical protein A4R35_00275 [Thermogemmatispora tikiterensis]
MDRFLSQGFDRERIALALAGFRPLEEVERRLRIDSEHRLSGQVIALPVRRPFQQAGPASSGLQDFAQLGGGGVQRAGGLLGVGFGPEPGEQALGMA